MRLKLCIEENWNATNKDKYQRLVGRVMYLSHIRLYSAYAVNMFSSCTIW